MIPKLMLDLTVQPKAVAVRVGEGTGMLVLVPHRLRGWVAKPRRPRPTFQSMFPKVNRP